MRVYRMLLFFTQYLYEISSFYDLTVVDFVLNTFKFYDLWLTFISFLWEDSYLWEEWKARHEEPSEDISLKFLSLRFVPLEVSLSLSLQRSLSIYIYIFITQHRFGLLLCSYSNNISPCQLRSEIWIGCECLSFHFPSDNVKYFEILKHNLFCNYFFYLRDVLSWDKALMMIEGFSYFYHLI